MLHYVIPMTSFGRVHDAGHLTHYSLINLFGNISNICSDYTVSLSVAYPTFCGNISLAARHPYESSKTPGEVLFALLITKSVRLDDEQIALLEAVAQLKGSTISYEVRHAVQWHLDRVLQSEDFRRQADQSLTEMEERLRRLRQVYREATQPGDETTSVRSGEPTKRTPGQNGEEGA